MYAIYYMLSILIFSYMGVSLSHYQDSIVNNIVISKGSRDCSSRYEVIKELAAQYKRPFTVLDLGASEGYFSFKLAHDFKATCVMIEGNYKTDSEENTADYLEDLCKKNTDLNSIILLKKNITPLELSILSESEHFDIVLALNVIHHFGSSWKQVIDALLDMGIHIIIETPPAEDKNAAGQNYISLILDYLNTKNGILMARFPRQTDGNVLDFMFLFTSTRTWLKRIHWQNSLPASDIDNYIITSTFDKKTFYKKKLDQLRSWYPGINLMTFKQLNGCYPSFKTITHELNKLEYIDHNDLKIWNIIINGNTLIPIDGDDPHWNLPWYNKNDDFTVLLNYFKCV